MKQGCIQCQQAEHEHAAENQKRLWRRPPLHDGKHAPKQESHAEFDDGCECAREHVERDDQEEDVVGEVELIGEG